MTQAKLLYIHGWHVSGKTTLAKLLDGHKQLAVMPYHDKLPSAFEKTSRTRIPYDTAAREFGQDIIAVDKMHSILTKSRYHRLQSFHHGRPVKLVASSKDIQEAALGEFDFHEFEEAWINRVNSEIKNPARSIALDRILIIILEEFFEHWLSYPYQKEDCNYFVGYGEKRSEPMKYLIENYKGSKIIFIRRDPRGCIASKPPKPETDDLVMDYLKEGAVYEIEQLFNDARELKRRYPERLLIISFEDLIVNTENTMSDIVEFLDIEDEKVLMNPTFQGECIDEENHIGEIQDTWQDMLTRQEIEIAELQMGERGLLSVSPRSWQPYIQMEVMRRIQQLVRRTGKRVAKSRFYRS